MVKIILIILILAAVGAIFINSAPKEKQKVQQQVVAALTPQDAVNKVKDLAAVKKYLAKVPGGRVDQNGSEGDLYLIQVYEIKDGHTATFNWYRVSKTTGKITAELENLPDLPELSKTYTDSKYGIQFNYPDDWATNTGTQIFENGDIITVEKLGPSQKPQTDFYDGVRFTVGLPIETEATLDQYLTDPDPTLKVATFALGENVFGQVDDYYYTKRGNLIYQLFLFSEGQDKDQNQAVLQEILASFSFLP